MNENTDHPARLVELAGDWTRYGEAIADPAWRDEMRRAVAVEMVVEITALAHECGLLPPSVSLTIRQ